MKKKCLLKEKKTNKQKTKTKIKEVFPILSIFFIFSYSLSTKNMTLLLPQILNGKLFKHTIYVAIGMSKWHNNYCSLGNVRVRGRRSFHVSSYTVSC